MKPLADCRLYAFVDTAYLHGRAPTAVAQQLCDGGADLIQLRAKRSPLDEVRRMAEAILPITRRANVGLVINDHLSIAREIAAVLPNGQLVVFPEDSGIWLARDELRAVIAGFLNQP